MNVTDDCEDSSKGKTLIYGSTFVVFSEEIEGCDLVVFSIFFMDEAEGVLHVLYSKKKHSIECIMSVNKTKIMLRNIYSQHLFLCCGMQFPIQRRK